MIYTEQEAIELATKKKAEMVGVGYPSKINPNNIRMVTDVTPSPIGYSDNHDKSWRVTVSFKINGELYQLDYDEFMEGRTV